MGGRATISSGREVRLPLADRFDRYDLGLLSLVAPARP